MNFYTTVYRGHTIEDEIEIEVHCVYHKEDDDIEIVSSINTFTEQPIELTPDERNTAVTYVLDEMNDAIPF